MASKTKQHYVPKLYLKNFSDGKFFNIYNLKKGLIENVPYGNQCYKNNFYGSDKIFEEKLSVLENNWACSILNVINSCESISIEDEKNLKEFCCFQQLRTEAAYYIRQNMMFDMAYKVIPLICQFHNLQISEDEIKHHAISYVKRHENPEESMKSQIKHAIQLSPVLNNLNLTILKNNSNIGFITSDNPIIIGNEYQPDGGLGLDCIGFFCLFPISPKLYVAITDSKIYYKFKNKKIINLKENTVRKLNLWLYKNCRWNIFFKDKKSLDYLLNDLECFSEITKNNLVTVYNQTFNNFLNNELKKQANDKFELLLEGIDKNIFYFLCKPLIDINIEELLALHDRAKPFKCQGNYNFHRSASLEKVAERICLMRLCTSDKLTDIIKKPVSKKDSDLVNLFETFLFDYFNNKL